VHVARIVRMGRVCLEFPLQAQPSPGTGAATSVDWKVFPEAGQGAEPFSSSLATVAE
jgi:hypothetical protein